MDQTEATSLRSYQVSEHPLKAILLVDDDRNLAESLQAALVEENYFVDVAYDGQQALLKLKANQYDIVVTDLMMPNLRGDQLYDEVKKLRPELANRVLLITGYPTDPTLKAFVDRAKLICLVKPFALNDLIAGVRQMLN